MNQNVNRRKFLAGSMAGIAALPFIPSILEAAVPSVSAGNRRSLMTLSRDDVVLFQGDSITDARRDREQQLANHAGSFGSGYAFIAASEMLNRFSNLNLTLYNRGISGNKVYQLAERWQKDCIDLKPRVLSILIGVNDFWHKLNGRYDGNLDVYETDYRTLLQNTRDLLPDVHFVIGEPFALRGCSAVDDRWFPEFDGYRAVAQKLAAEFDAVFIPYHSLFEKAAQVMEPAYWAYDGVHPSMGGAQLMAQAWLKAVCDS